MAEGAALLMDQVLPERPRVPRSACL